jgi:hypothetical protein
MVVPGGTKEDEEYFTSLGRFVFEFMVAENTMFLALSRFSGLNKSDAAALLSGSKVDANCSLMRRLYEARDLPIPKEVDDALSHLVMLNNLRNNHLHHLVHPNNSVSNEIRALPKRVQKSTTSVKLLRDGNNDLFKVISTLVSYFFLQGPHTNGWIT